MMLPAPPRLTRRGVLAGLATLAVAQPLRWAAADDVAAITVKQVAGGAAFEPALPNSFGNGDRLRFNLTNSLAAPITLAAFGLDGVSTLQPLLNAAIAPGRTQLIDAPLAQSGTFAVQARTFDDGLGRSAANAAFSVGEPSPLEIDQDRILLIEDARLRGDGTAIQPGTGAGDARVAYTINRLPSFELKVRANERLRLRLINGCQRNAIALQFDDHDLRVIAIDSRPAEPFLARDRRLILAPGTRMDVLVDATQPAGSISAVQLFDGGGPKRIGQLVYVDSAPARANILPAAAPLADVPVKLELAAAQRAQLDLGATDWVAAKDFVDKRPLPAFRVKRGRTVLLTLTNRTTLPTTFRLYGHHFRWLDRLDDGWKPFLLDTMLVDVGQTERIAFRADFPGDWLIENAAMNWAAPQLFHWFVVE